MTKKKSIFKTCWKEYTTWFKAEWKNAWHILSETFISLIEAVWEWLYAIIGSAVGGLWKIVLKPVLVAIKEYVINWIKRI